MRIKKVLFMSVIGFTLLCNACGNANNPVPQNGIVNSPSGPTAYSQPTTTPLEKKTWSIWSQESKCSNSPYPYQQAYLVFELNQAGQYIGEYNYYSKVVGWVWIQFTYAYGANQTITLSNWVGPECSPDGNNNTYSLANCKGQVTAPTGTLAYQYITHGQSMTGSIQAAPLAMANLQLLSIAGYGAGTVGYGGAAGAPAGQSDGAIVNVLPESPDPLFCGGVGSAWSDLYLN